MEIGLYPKNYFDFEDDEVATQREIELVDTFNGVFHDPTFPADARSMYFDPFSPSKGGFPGDSIFWCSIADGALADCFDPKVFLKREDSWCIRQGALGNNYFVNALRLIACNANMLQRLIVSEVHSVRGVYTFKFCKAGRWRYLHIDDSIPCRQSGHENYCRNENPNETFAMLIEKAYAKLHGCYEALSYGLIEKALADMTHAAHIETLRFERIPKETLCDAIWEKVNETVDTTLAGTGNKAHNIVGCGRFLEDSYTDNVHDRLGITLNMMYHVVDIYAVTAEATADLDELTVGMVCIRNLQRNRGRFTGRWSYNDRLWVEYPEIGEKLRLRTQSLVEKLGYAPLPSRQSARAKSAGHGLNIDEYGNDINDSKQSSEGKTSSGGAGMGGDVDDGNCNAKIAVSPMFGDDNGGQAAGNDSYFHRNDIDLTDESDNILGGLPRSNIVQPEATNLIWMQIEDFVQIFNRMYCVTDPSLDQKNAMACKRYLSKWVPGDFIGGSAGAPVVQKVAEDDEEEGDDENKEEDTAKGDDGIGVVDEHPGNGAAEEAVRGDTQTPLRYKVNDAFADNPMYPMVINEPTDLWITLFQRDRRWSQTRFGPGLEGLQNINYLDRRDRLSTCMKYSDAIGFVVLQLFGLKMRVTDFKLEKISACCEALERSNECSGRVSLKPGRYVIVPYTFVPVDAAKEYSLSVHYKQGAVDFEVNDLLAERPVDDTLSENSDDDDEDDDDYDDDDERPKHKQIVIVKKSSYSVAELQKYPIPSLTAVQSWEYTEDIEETGIISVFEELGNVAKYVNSLRREVRSLTQSMDRMKAAASPVGKKKRPSIFRTEAH
jgi:hypothetical protein